METNLWNSPPIADRLLNDQFIETFREKAISLVIDDAPSSNDLRYIFRRYNAASPQERDAIDAAFVWFTGFTVGSIAKQVTGE